jgi:hypothetical protein
LRIHKVEHPVNANPSHAFDDKPSRDHLRNVAGTDLNCLGTDGEKLGLGLDRSWAYIAEETGSSWPIGWLMSRDLTKVVESEGCWGGWPQLTCSPFSEGMQGW